MSISAHVIQSQINSVNSYSNSLRYEIQQCQAQVGLLEDKRQRLLEELAALEGFESEQERDFANLISQADERTAAFAGLKDVANILPYADFAAKLEERTNSVTKRDIEDAHRDVASQVARAINEINAEIDQIGHQVSSLNATISGKQMQIYRNDSEVNSLTSSLRLIGG